MTNSEVLAMFYDSYTEEELLNAKDEPDTDFAAIWSGSATVISLFGRDENTAYTTREGVNRAFHGAGHGMQPADALSNARRVLGVDRAA